MAATKKTEVLKDTSAATHSDIAKSNGKVKEIRYSDNDLEYFKKHIMNIKVDAIDELRMLKERLDDLTNSEMASESMIYSMHMAEQGSEAMEKKKPMLI